MKALAFNVAAATPKSQLLAIGDDEGVLRVAEVPSMLRRPTAGEHARMRRFLDTQARKVHDVEQRQVRTCSWSTDAQALACTSKARQTFSRTPRATPPQVPKGVEHTFVEVTDGLGSNSGSLISCAVDTVHVLLSLVSAEPRCGGARNGILVRALKQEADS